MKYSFIILPKLQKRKNQQLWDVCLLYFYNYNFRRESNVRLLQVKTFQTFLFHSSKLRKFLEPSLYDTCSDI